jgi:hypothetical protein
LLINLLKSEENKPQNYREIGLFLLKHKSKIYPYICKNIHDNVDILSDVIHKIINSREAEVRLDFLGNCSLSKDYLFYFPIERLGLILSADSNSIANWKKSAHGRRYIPAFSIIKIENKFFAEVELEPFNAIQTKACVQNKISSNSPLKNKNCRIIRDNLSQNPKTKNDIRTSPEKNYSLLSHSERKIANAVDIANAINGKRDRPFNWNWGGGCIWTISGGGGPGSGKKR